jgi:hypothetical protein
MTNVPFTMLVTQQRPAPFLMSRHRSNFKGQNDDNHIIRSSLFEKCLGAEKP